MPSHLAVDQCSISRFFEGLRPKLFHWIERGLRVEELDKENRKGEKKESKEVRKKLEMNQKKKDNSAHALKQNIVQFTTDAASKSS